MLITKLWTTIYYCYSSLLLSYAMALLWSSVCLKDPYSDHCISCCTPQMSSYWPIVTGSKYTATPTISNFPRVRWIRWLDECQPASMTSGAGCSATAYDLIRQRPSNLAWFTETSWCMFRWANRHLRQYRSACIESKKPWCHFRLVIDIFGPCHAAGWTLLLLSASDPWHSSITHGGLVPRPRSSLDPVKARLLQQSTVRHHWSPHGAIGWCPEGCCTSRAPTATTE